MQWLAACADPVCILQGPLQGPGGGCSFCFGEGQAAFPPGGPVQASLSLCHSLQKHPLPDDWHLEETRRLFLQPEVADPSQVVLEWREPDEEGLVQFLAHEKHMK